MRQKTIGFFNILSLIETGLDYLLIKLRDLGDDIALLLSANFGVDGQGQGLVHRLKPAALMKLTRISQSRGL